MQTGTSLAPATSLTFQAISDSVSPTAPLDRYQFVLNSPSSLRVSLNSTSNVATITLVRDANLNQVVDANEELASQNTSSTTPAQLEFQTLSAGTYYLVVNAANASQSLNYTLQAATTPEVDTDILWRNPTTQELGYWRFDGTTFIGTQPIQYGSWSLAGWEIVGIGDFNGDRLDDIAWRNSSTNEVGVWLMGREASGQRQVAGGGVFPVAVGSDWQLGGVGDLDGDGKADWVWRNPTQQLVSFWLLDGGTIRQTGTFAGAVGAEWALEGVGDFDGNGRTDLFWRNRSTLQTATWLMNGTAVTQGTVLQQTMPLNLRVEGFGDFSGDGKTDILLRNTGTGVVSAWLVNNNQIVQAQLLYNNAAITVATNWQIVGTDDFTGDRKADVVWRNLTTGEVAIWTIDGLQITQAQLLSDPILRDLNRKAIGTTTRPVIADLPPIETVPPVIELALESDTGVAGDRTTRLTPILGRMTDSSGLAEVLVSLNSQSFVNILSWLDANGNVRLDRTRLETILGSSLSDRTYQLAVRATDRFGNLANTTSTPFSWTLDTTAPATPTLDLPEASDSGISNQDNITRNPVTLTGTADAGSQVQISINGTPIPLIASNGTWNTSLSNLSEGAQTITAVASDVAGNVSQPSTSLVVQIDALAPTLTVSSIANNATLVTNSRLIGEVNGTGTDIVQLIYFFNNKPLINLPVSSNGRFDVAIDYQGIGDGSHTLNLVATDRAGSVKALQFAVTVTLDTVAPLLSVELANDTASTGVNTDRITSDATVRGTVTDASGVASLQASFGTGASATFVDILPQVTTNGQFTLNQALLTQINGGTLPNGTYALRVRSQDLYGNSREVVLNFTLDTKAPRQPGFSLAPSSDTGIIGDSRTSRTTVQLLGLTEKDAIVRFGQSNISTQANSEGEFIAGQYTLDGVTLAPGGNAFTVEAFDQAGNRSVFSQTIYRVSNDSSDVIVDWNTTALRAIQFARTAPPRAVYNLAVMHGAMFDAVNAIEREYQIYKVDASVLPNTSAIAAAAAAAHRVLVRFYPTQTSFFDAQLAASLATVADGTPEDQGVALGRFVADALLNDRQGDGANATVAYQPGMNPGEWQPTGNTLLGYPGAALPQWGQVRPFALDTGNQFRPDGPPALNSPEYATELNQVKAFGAKTNSTRTEDQSQIAEFWSDGAGTYSPPGHWNQIAQTVTSQQNNSILENARVFALLNVGLTDAGIAAWDAKYAYNFWRPETAIRRADEDNNPATIADPNWQSFLVTPNHPDYVSGHSTFSGTAATVLSSVFGNTYSFNSSSLGLPGIYRNFDSFDAAAAEAGISRIYGGIHYQSANQEGLTLGRQVGQYVVDRFFRPVVKPPLQAGLANDTAPQGATNQDGITTDATIQGAIAANLVNAVTLSVGLNDAPLSSYQNLTGLVQPNGTFTISTAQLTSLAGGTLSDGQYVVNLRIVDTNGSVVATEAVSFKLDRVAPTVNLQSPIADAAYSATARAIGQVLDANGAATSARYSVDGQSMQTLPVNAQGKFDQRLIANDLAAGAHTLVLETSDVAGNLRQTTVNFTVNPNLTATGTSNAGWAVQTSDGIVLAEGSSFKTQASLSVPLGQTTGTRTLSFNVTPNFDVQDTNAIVQDRLLVYLVDPQNPSQTLLNSGEAGTPVFTLAGQSTEFIPGLVTYNGTTVTIDVSSLGSRSEGLLVFQLINNDGDTKSTVRISDLSNVVDPNGTSSPVLPPTIVRGTQGGSITDFTDFAPTNHAELLVSNVHLDTATGRYIADLQVRNTGTTPLSRNLAILFSQLPQGVSVIGASGIHPAGSPYLNLATALPPGDLAPGSLSPVVQVVFNSPNSVQFDLQPVVLAGRLDQPPMLASLGNLTVEAGGRLEIPLVAVDPDGNRVTLSMRPNDNLPTGRLQADGTLIFTPSPQQAGTYTFTLVAKSGNLETTQDVTLTVTDDALTTTRVSGSILNTDQAPLAGILVEVDGWQSITDAMGRFMIELPGVPPNDTLKVYADRLTGGSVVYPFIAEKLPLVLEHAPYAGVNNVIARPIYLPPIDVAHGVTVKPNQDVVVTTPNLPGAAVTIKAGSLFDKNGNAFTNKLSITAVPPDLTPAALPDTLRPGLVVTIQPGDMVFQTPAPLTLPNVEGYAPGSDMDLWSINPVTGVFDRVGLARVSADGSVVETIEGGIRNSSWHFVAPPPPVCPDGPRTPDCGCCECADGAPFTSVVSTQSGGLTEAHSLVTYNSSGENRGARLVYDSLRADARPILRYDFTGLPNRNNVVVTTDLTIKGKNFSYQVPGFSGDEIGLRGGQHFWRVPSNSFESGFTIAMQADLRDRPSGRYQYTSMTGSQGNVTVTVPGLGSQSLFVGSLNRYEGNLINVNTINSNFGSGWGIAGVQELVENLDGSILLIDGDGSELIFEKNAQSGEYFSAPGDFSKLVKLADGRFQRTMQDQTVYTFDASNRLVSVVDSRGRTMQHIYNSAGQLVKMIDPAGLETVLTYNNGKLSEIKDPANRTTKLGYDAQGNLIKITDPDNSVRMFEYDDGHRMTAEIDQRGFREEAFYNFAGRAVRAIRKDGSEVQLSPAETVGLYRPEETINPFNAPIALRGNDPSSTYVDANGNVKTIVLDGAGQVVSSQDGVGQQSSNDRNGQNLTTQSRDARGNLTSYSYDERGNVTKVVEYLNNPLDPDPALLTFDYGESIYANNDVVDLRAVDVNSDGNADLITLEENGDIAIRIGSNDGLFTESSTSTTNETAFSLETGDINGDGNVDFVVSTIDNITSEVKAQIFLNNGRGEFNLRNSINLGVNSGNQKTVADSVSLADVNNDRILDLIYRQDDRIIARTGRENGDFSAALNSEIALDSFDEIKLGSGYGAEIVQTIAIGDVDRDGNTDVVALQRSGFVVMTGNGRGVFTPSYVYQLPDPSSPDTINLLGGLKLADINGDNRLDLLVSDSSAGNLLTFLGNETAIFQNPLSYKIDEDLGQIQTTDLNRDGLLDVVVASQDYGYHVVMGAGNGTYVRQFTEYGGAARGIASVDVDNDRGLDLITVGSSSNAIDVWLNTRKDKRVERSYTYDSIFNKVTSETDELGRATLYNIDPETGDMRSVTRVIGQLDAISGEEDDLVTSYTYLQDGQIDTMTDALGRVTDYDYNILGRLVKVTYAKGTTDAAFELYEYDSAGNRTAVTDANGNRTEYEYDARNRLIRVIQPDPDGIGSQVSPIIEYEYDAVGNQIKVKDPRGFVTQSVYDAMGQLIQIIQSDPDGEGPLLQLITTQEYDFAGNLVASIDPLGQRTQNRYDSRNRLVEIIHPDGSSQMMKYDLDNNVTSETNAKSSATIKKLDTRGRVIQEIDALNRSTFYRYDDVNQVIERESASGNIVQYRYDELGRQIETIDSQGKSTKTRYDKLGNIVAYIDELGHTTQYIYDSRNRRVQIIDPLNNTTSTSYDAVGNVLKLTDSSLNTTTYSYDALNQLTSEVNQLGLARQFRYDEAGNLISAIDRNGRERNYVYDGLGRRTRENWLGSNNQIIRTIQSTYDAVGQLVEVSDAESRYRYSYDFKGHVIQIDNQGTLNTPRVQLVYSYDANGNIVSVTDSINGQESSTKNYVYDLVDRVSQITQTGDNVNDKRVDITYNKIDQVSSMRYYADLAGSQLGVLTEYSYDERDRLKTLRHTQANGTVISTYDYDFDDASRIVEANESNGSADETIDYSYRSDNQLISANRSGVGLDETYSYDSNGNRTNSGYQTSADNRLDSDGIYTYEYDGEGNLVKRIGNGMMRQFAWDYRNRLVSVIDTVGNNIIRQVSYAYDVDNQRIAKTVDSDGTGAEMPKIQRFVYDRNHVIMDFEGNKTTPSARYLYGSNVDQIFAQDIVASNTTSWMLTDQLGSVRTLVNNDGEVVNRFDYDSFGNVSNNAPGPVNTRYRYAGREFDSETGLYYYRARYYDAGVGRFISQDPLGFNGDGHNLYTYALNYPIDRTDPFGERSKLRNVIASNFNREIKYIDETGKEETAYNIATVNRARANGRFSYIKKDETSAYLTSTSGSGTGTGASVKAFDMVGGDDAGHIIGSQLGGSGSNINNLFAQNRAYNRGWAGTYPYWRQYEDTVRRELSDDLNSRGRSCSCGNITPAYPEAEMTVKLWYKFPKSLGQPRHLALRPISISSFTTFKINVFNSGQYIAYNTISTTAPNP